MGLPVHGYPDWFGRRTHCTMYVVGATDGSSDGVRSHRRHGHRADCLAVCRRLQARRSDAVLRKYRCVTYIALLVGSRKRRGKQRNGRHRLLSAIVLRFRNIYTTKIGTFVCPPHISETIAVRIMKLAHRPRVASTTKKLISKQMFLSILSNIC